MEKLLKKKRRWQRIRFALTTQGKAFVLVTLGVGFAAVNTSSNLLFLTLGLMLSLLILNGVMGDTSLWGVSLRIISESRLFVGETAYLKLEVENIKSRSSSYTLLIRDDFRDSSLSVFRIAPKTKQQPQLAWTPEKRGVRNGIELALSTEFPFGFIRKTRVFEFEHESVIYPSVDFAVKYKQQNERTGILRDSEYAGGGNQVVGLQEYASPMPARDIHWVRTAALGFPVSKERARDVDSRFTLVVDNHNGHSDDSLDDVVRNAASRLLRAVDSGVEVDLHCRGCEVQHSVAGVFPVMAMRTLALLSVSEEPLPETGRRAATVLGGGDD